MSGEPIEVVKYPAAFCACESSVRRWNGYGTCLRCGGAYEPSAGRFERIEIPRDEEPKS